VKCVVRKYFLAIGVVLKLKHEASKTKNEYKKERKLKRECAKRTFQRRGMFK
jgi:hypothetical protein